MTADEATSRPRWRAPRRVGLGGMMIAVAIAAVGLARARVVEKDEAIAIAERLVRDNPRRWPANPRRPFVYSASFRPATPGSTLGHWIISPHRGPTGCSNGSYYIESWRSSILSGPRVSETPPR